MTMHFITHVTAEDILRQLEPIFEQIRRQSEMPYAYPLTVAGRKSLIRPSYYLVNLRRPPLHVIEHPFEKIYIYI